MRRAATALASLFLTLSAPNAASPALPSTPTRPTAEPTKKSVPFIEDDYTGALAEARARNLPLFIEAWAPW